MKYITLFVFTGTILITHASIFSMDYQLQIPVTTDTIKIIKTKLELNDLILKHHNNASAQLSNSELQLFISNNEKLRSLLKKIDDSDPLIALPIECNGHQEHMNSMTLSEAIEYFKKIQS